MEKDGINMNFVWDNQFMSLDRVKLNLSDKDQKWLEFMDTFMF